MGNQSNRRAEGSDRGKRASFDRKTGEVSGSGAGAGNAGTDNEEYDDDLDVGSGDHPTGGEPGNPA